MSRCHAVLRGLARAAASHNSEAQKTPDVERTALVQWHVHRGVDAAESEQWPGAPWTVDCLCRPLSHGPNSPQDCWESEQPPSQPGVHSGAAEAPPRHPFPAAELPSGNSIFRTEDRGNGTTALRQLTRHLFIQGVHPAYFPEEFRAGYKIILHTEQDDYK